MPSDFSGQNRWAIVKRQWTVFGIFLVMLGVILLVMIWNDRQREWLLRDEQADHRLELAFELITRDLERVRSDLLFVADQRSVQQFDGDQPRVRKALEEEFSSFLHYKRTYQQIRLINLKGMETVRVDLRNGVCHAVPVDRLQDKSDRYYVRESYQLKEGEVFVSHFDLNQEQGVIERPLVPVIRFVTPVVGEDGTIRHLLVLNYLGKLLLHDPAGISLPGSTWLIRGDSHYLLGPHPSEAWGWLLGHDETFGKHFPVAWENRDQPGCFLTSRGAFAFETINLQRFGYRQKNRHQQSDHLWIVSYLPRERVFESSNQLLNRLLLFAAILLLPVFLLTRFWAIASVRRKQQHELIMESERKLRELNSRLIRIQEEERRAISREIHDQLGQQATAINLDLKLAERQIQSEEARSQITRAIEESDQLIDTLHHFATRVRPTELDDLGLHDALESQLWDFRGRTNISFDFQSNIEHAKLPSDISENVYRLVQESLNNVIKHANATHVVVSIHVDRQGDQPTLYLSIRDDGVGGASESESRGQSESRSDGSPRLGILGMRERVDLLGGTLNLESAVYRGTTIEVTLPLNDFLDDGKGTR